MKSFHIFELYTEANCMFNLSGLLRTRRPYSTQSTTNKRSEATWQARPAIMMLTPMSLSSRSSAVAVMAPPAACKTRELWLVKSACDQGSVVPSVYLHKVACDKDDRV